MILCMKIGSYVAGARKWVNDKAGDINPGKVLRAGLTGLVIGGAVVSSGCAVAAAGAVGYHLGKDAGADKVKNRYNWLD